MNTSFDLLSAFSCIFFIIMHLFILRIVILLNFMNSSFFLLSAFDINILNFKSSFVLLSAFDINILNFNYYLSI